MSPVDVAISRAQDLDVMLFRTDRDQDTEALLTAAANAIGGVSDAGFEIDLYRAIARAGEALAEEHCEETGDPDGDEYYLPGWVEAAIAKARDDVAVHWLISVGQAVAIHEVPVVAEPEAE